eukprot:CAMPEP_0185268124 /NCGR_PEP_ID=MMETSP1359-20130426/36265_1 /TAXON_ID=552665 /ORGANISM="Bigelowiella longifila, Strain CCMP242" /LENGTH=87 /DNA_ID=CAMNT_0027858779 /DNA_START=213 /DNA_END=473 /DNA_ORIENTATION=+
MSTKAFFFLGLLLAFPFRSHTDEDMLLPTFDSSIVVVIVDEEEEEECDGEGGGDEEEGVAKNFDVGDDAGGADEDPVSVEFIAAVDE